MNAVSNSIFDSSGNIKQTKLKTKLVKFTILFLISLQIFTWRDPSNIDREYSILYNDISCEI